TAIHSAKHSSFFPFRVSRGFLRSIPSVLESGESERIVEQSLAHRGALFRLLVSRRFGGRALRISRPRLNKRRCRTNASNRRKDKGGLNRRRRDRHLAEMNLIRASAEVEGWGSARLRNSR